MESFQSAIDIKRIYNFLITSYRHNEKLIMHMSQQSGIHFEGEAVTLEKKRMFKN